jgi:threonine synthase
MSKLTKNFIRVCSNCAKYDVKLSRCSRCKKVSYCSTECQKIHWKNHKSVCNGLAEQKGSAFDNTYATNPLIFWQEKYPKQWTIVNAIMHTLPKDSTKRWVYLGENKERDEGTCVLFDEDKIVSKAKDNNFYQSCLDLHRQDKDKDVISVIVETNHSIRLFHAVIGLGQLK